MEQHTIPMMKAAVCTRYGPPEVIQLREVPRPEPAVNEVRVRVVAAAATTASLAGRRGEPRFTRLFMGLTQPKKNILGQEIAGEIEAVGKDVTRFKPGDQIFGNTQMRMGAFAEFVCLPEDAAITKKPDNLSFEESVAIIEGPLTAVNFLRRGQLQAGQRILINGASGAVGSATVQVAKQLGAIVTGVCSAANFEMVRALGADAVIDYTREDFTQNGQTYDVIFNTVGKRSFAECRNSLTPSGVYLDAAGIATMAPMLWTALFGRKKAIIAATYVRPARELLTDLEQVKVMAEAGQIWPIIDRCYALAQTAEAHTYVETERKKGNVVITIEHP